LRPYLHWAAQNQLDHRVRLFAGQNVGIKEVSDKVWLVSFMQYDLSFFDHETGRVTSAENPFGAKVFPCVRNNLLPMCPEQTVGNVVSAPARSAGGLKSISRVLSGWSSSPNLASLLPSTSVHAYTRSRQASIRRRPDCTDRVYH
jgi:hypothetical protein